jgi:hypothetical protein
MQPLWLTDSTVLGIMVLSKQLFLAYQSLGADSAKHSPLAPSWDVQHVFLV